MRDDNASDSQIGLVMGNLKQDIVDLTDADTAPIAIDKTPAAEETTARQEIERAAAVEDADQM